MLADHLLASLDGPNQKEIDAAWSEKAERRMREIEEGKVEPIRRRVSHAEVAVKIQIETALFDQCANVTPE